MRDGCFERRLSRGPLDVEVNPLPVFSRFGKLVDAILRNVEPVADADLFAEILVELIDTVDMNHGSMPAITRSVWYRAVLFGHDFNSAGSQISSLHPDHHRRTSSPCRNVTCVASSLRAVAQ